MPNQIIPVEIMSIESVGKRQTEVNGWKTANRGIFKDCPINLLLFLQKHYGHITDRYTGYFLSGVYLPPPPLFLLNKLFQKTMKFFCLKE